MRPGRRQKRLILLIGVVTSGLILWLLVVDRLVFNRSASLPHWAFLLTRLDPGRDNLVVFRPPASAQYDCPFIKRVAAVPGDRVIRKDQCFFVEGASLGCAKAVTEQGRILEPARGGIIPNGYFWVHTDHPDSYDSRYAEIGLIPKDAIMGRAFALGGPQPPDWLAWITDTFGDPDATPACQMKTTTVAVHQGDGP